MILNKLTIENFGEIKRFETTFDSRLTIVSGSNADDIIKAIGVVTKNKSLSGQITRQMLSENTFISAEVEAMGRQLLINARGQPSKGGYEHDILVCNDAERISPVGFFENIRLCEEEESLTYYRFNQKDVYSERFLHYKDPEKYYSPGDFQRRTDGTGSTHSFRACLTKYIREYQPENNLIEEYTVGILPDGRIIGYSVNAPNELIPFEKPNIQMFDYLCFLNVNEFWENFETIRDFNHERWPVFVDTTAFVCGVDFEKMLVKSYGLGRQLIVMEAENLEIEGET